MAIVLAIWAVCFLSVISNGRAAAAENQHILLPKNNSHVPIPCVGLQPAERPSLLYWFIGETWEVAMGSLLLRYSDPGVGQNFTESDRYSVSHGFGLVIGQLDTTDSGRYWCRVIRGGAESIESVDVTVVVKDSRPGPVIWWNPSTGSVSKVDIKKQQILNCSVDDVYPNPDLTWSFIGCRSTANQSMELFTSNQQSTYDVFSKTYRVTKRAHFGALDLKIDDKCEFECIAKGVAIHNGSSATAVEIFTTAQQPESKSTSTTTIFIILAVILFVCFIALAYLVWRVFLPQRRIIKQEIQELVRKEPTGTPDEKTGLFMEINPKEMEDITAEGTTQWSSRRSLEDYSGLFKRSEQTGDILEVVGSDSQGLLLTTSKAVIRYPNKQEARPEIFTKDKFSGNVTNIVLHPQSETLIVVLKTTGKKVKTSLLYVDMNSGNYGEPVELTKFTSPKVTVDGAGAIFVGELDGKRLLMFERHSDTRGEYTLDINNKLQNIAAYGWKRLFVVNGKDTINKYIFKRTSGCLNMLKIRDCITISPAQETGLGEIVVYNHQIYVVNGVQILAYDVEVFEKLHTFETGFQDLQGLCFFGLNGVALYSNKRVQVYEIEKKKEENGHSSATV
ncbi:uncharacterized protein [Asterias amurensis]